MNELIHGTDGCTEARKGIGTITSDWGTVTCPSCIAHATKQKDPYPPKCHWGGEGGSCSTPRKLRVTLVPERVTCVKCQKVAFTFATRMNVKEPLRHHEDGCGCGDAPGALITSQPDMTTCKDCLGLIHRAGMNIGTLTEPDSLNCQPPTGSLKTVPKE